MDNGLGLSGVPVDDVLMQEALQRIEKMIEDGGTHQVATANVDYLVHATKDIEYRRILCMCDMVLADGMPIVWVSRLFGIPLRERVAGADLVPHLARLSALRGYKIFLLGATPEVAEAAQRRMKALNPNVRVVGHFSPPIRPIDEFDNEPILARIEAAQPDILLVAFGSPKQEKWIGRNRHRLKVPVCIGIGGSLDFLAQSVRRAPAWMQKSGMEWLFRMCVDPVRLGPRYFHDAVWLTKYLSAQLPVKKIFQQQEETPIVSLNSIGAVSIIGVSGAMSGSGLTRLEKALSSVTAGRPIVLDLTGTSHMGADGLWILARILRRAAERKTEVWLAGLSPALERQLRLAHFADLFKSATSSSDAVRQISPGKLQINVELGESWAVCRVTGDLSEGVRRTLEEICNQLRKTNDHFEIDASGLVGADSSKLIGSMGSLEGVVYGEAPRARAAGAA